MLALVAGVLTSCDMDKEPYGVLPDKGTLGAFELRGVHAPDFMSLLKGCVGGETNYVAPGLQCENFNAVSGFSNTLSTMYRWEFTTDDGVFSGMYGSAQGTITRCNFIIDGYNSTDFSNTSLWNPQRPDLGLLKLLKRLRVTRSSHVLMLSSCLHSTSAMLTTRLLPTSLTPVLLTL